MVSPAVMRNCTSPLERSDMTLAKFLKQKSEEKCHANAVLNDALLCSTQGVKNGHYWSICSPMTFSEATVSSRDHEASACSCSCISSGEGCIGVPSALTEVFVNIWLIRCSTSTNNSASSSATKLSIPNASTHWKQNEYSAKLSQSWSSERKNHHKFCQHSS